MQSVDSSCLSTPPTATGIVASRLGFRIALHDVRVYDLDIRSVLPCPLLLPLLLMLLLLLILKLALLVLVLALVLVLYKLRVLEVVVVVAVVVVVVAAVVLLLLLLLQLLLLLLPILPFSNSGREPRNARTTGPAKVDKRRIWRVRGLKLGCKSRAFQLGRRSQDTGPSAHAPWVLNKEDAESLVDLRNFLKATLDQKLRETLVKECNSKHKVRPHYTTATTTSTTTTTTATTTTATTTTTSTATTASCTPPGSDDMY